MSGLACGKCLVFMKVKKGGITIEEGRPLDNAGNWGPYKLWKADLAECPKCGHQMITGFGGGPIAEHYQKDYQIRRERHSPVFGRIDACAGMKP